ncbi:MAG: hypothetical protein ACD_6C00227G0001 [uncultured bacterium]|nr:MAG: hypothetical protein ACD_6C00227G0001 [uncultured bacterium]
MMFQMIGTILADIIPDRACTEPVSQMSVQPFGFKKTMVRGIMHQNSHGKLASSKNGQCQRAHQDFPPRR